MPTVSRPASAPGSTRARRRGRMMAAAAGAVCLVLASCATTTPRNGAVGQADTLGAGPAGTGGVQDVGIGLDPAQNPGDVAADGSVQLGPDGQPLPANGGASGTGGAGPAAGEGGGTPGAPGGPAPGGPAPGGPAPGGPAPGGGGGAPGAQGKGVTDKEVKVGFVVIENTDDQAANNGFQAADSGDPRKVVEALVAYVNANGGIGGRTIRPEFESTSLATANAQSEQAACTSFVQDKKVFAVVPMALIYEDTRACYAQGQTILLDTSGFPYDKTTYERLSPFYWSPGFPDYTRTAKSMVAALSKTDYFKDGKVGIVTYENAAYRRTIERDYKPALAAAGVNNVEVRYIEQTSLASTQSGTNSAVVAFNTQQINRVLFVGAASLTTFFMNSAENQRYRPRYGLSTWDSPSFLALNARQSGGFVSPEQLKGAVGIGFVPSSDVSGSKYPWPSAKEKPCLDALAKAGLEYKTHYDAARPLAYCSSLLFLKAVGDRAGAVLDPGAFQRTAEGLGTSFNSPISLSDRVGPGAQHATGASYAPLAYDAACGCFNYTGAPTGMVG